MSTGRFNGYGFPFALLHSDVNINRCIFSLLSLAMPFSLLPPQHLLRYILIYTAASDGWRAANVAATALGRHWFSMIWNMNDNAGNIEKNVKHEWFIISNISYSFNASILNIVFKWCDLIFRAEQPKLGDIVFHNKIFFNLSFQAKNDILTTLDHNIVSFPACRIEGFKRKQQFTSIEAGIPLLISHYEHVQNTQ